MDIKKLIWTGILLILTTNLGFFTSAITVRDINIGNLRPGESNNIVADIENIFSDVVEDISLTIDLTGLPFTTIGSSEYAIDEIEEDENKNFRFEIKAANDAELGDYQIPYTLKYSLDGEQITRTGSFGIKVSAEPEVEFSVETDLPVIGEKSKIEIKIINTGFGDIKFVSVKIFPQGFRVFSEQQVYIGNVDSDDFESASFDVVFNSRTADVRALVEYRDFENNLIRKNIDFPLEVYNHEEAVNLGIIEKNNSLLYIGVTLGLIILWIAYRSVIKRRRLRKSKERS